MIGMANMVSGIDIDPNRRHCSLLSLRFPQRVSLRDESNFRSTFRFNARMTPIRANIVGPPDGRRDQDQDLHCRNADYLMQFQKSCCTGPLQAVGSVRGIQSIIAEQTTTAISAKTASCFG